MGERYWITGVQIKMIFDNRFSKRAKQKIYSAVVKTQFIGDFKSLKQKRIFEKEIRNLIKS